MSLSNCGHGRHHRGILGGAVLLITGRPAKSRKLPVDILLVLSLSLALITLLLLPGHRLLPAAGQLPHIFDDVVKEEVVAPVHHVDQEEHEREEHQGDAVHAVTPEDLGFCISIVVVGKFKTVRAKSKYPNLQ